MRADRLLAMMMLLQRKGKMTARALATELEVSSRTVLRDVEALSMAGIPIYTDGGHGGGITLDEKYRTTLTGLKEEELHTLFVGSNQQLLRDVGLGEAAANTQRKLSAALPTQHQQAIDYMRQRILIDPLWWWHNGQTVPFLTELQEVIFQNRLIEVRYENYDGHIGRRTLEPYALVAKSSLWYLLAKRDDAWRTYRVSRLQEVVLLDQEFVRDPTFDLPSYWQERAHEFVAAFSQYEFILRVHPDGLPLVRWLTPGRSEGDEADIDGWVTMHFQLESEMLAKMLVFGLGQQCEVIAPDALRMAVKERCRQLLDIF